MDKKIISALNKQMKIKLADVMPVFSLCPDDVIDKKLYMNGMKAYVATFEKRHGYIITNPYVKAYNQFSISLAWSPREDRAVYTMPMAEHHCATFYVEHKQIPDEYAECCISLNSVMRENRVQVMCDDMNMFVVSVAREEIVDKEKLYVAVDAAIDRAIKHIKTWGLPVLQS